MLKPLLPLILVAGAAFAQPALAGAEPDVVTFSYSPSELETQDGVRRVYRRMSVKAEQMCRAGWSRTPARENACAVDLKSDWVRAIGDPRLAALHRGGALYADRR